jgi:hypothetical protein
MFKRAWVGTTRLLALRACVYEKSGNRKRAWMSADGLDWDIPRYPLYRRFRGVSGSETHIVKPT